ncbi:MAG: (2Fe-2S)-binding protein [Proteobacteria bacterium]|nr:(2Fe-2S)-binding protein [Pseudomonadota bacterium]
MPITFEVNGHPQTVDADPSMPLLWALRDLLGLPGTKYGCGIAACGACTALLERNPRPSRDEVREAMDHVLCRCGTYLRIESAVQRAAELMKDKETQP